MTQDTYSFPQLTKLYRIKKSDYKQRTKLIRSLQGKKIKIIFPKKCRNVEVIKKIKELCKQNKQRYQTVLASNLITIDGKPRKLTKILCQFFDEKTVSQSLAQDNVIELEITGEYKDLLNVSNSDFYTSCLNPKGCNKHFVRKYAKDPSVFLLVQRVPGKIGFAKRSVCKIFCINGLEPRQFKDIYGHPHKEYVPSGKKQMGIFISVIYGHAKKTPPKVIVPEEFKGMKFFVNCWSFNAKYRIADKQPQIHDAFAETNVKPIPTIYEKTNKVEVPVVKIIA